MQKIKKKRTRSQENQWSVQPQTIQNSPQKNVLQENNSEFNTSPQRRKIETNARKNLEQLSYLESIELNVSEPKPQNNVQVNCKLIKVNKICGWDGDDLEYDDKRSITQIKQRPQSRQYSQERMRSRIKPSRTLSFTNDSEQLFVTRPETYSQQTPYYEKIQITPQRKLTKRLTSRNISLKDELESIRQQRQKCWVEQFKQNDKLLKVIGGMQSLVVVKGAPTNRQIAIDSRPSFKHKGQNSSVLYIDSPLKCVAQSISSRIHVNRMKQIQQIQNLKYR